MGKITAILFDCDNTLVLSEELAFEGCADLLNEICKQCNVPLEKPFTGPTLIKDFVGQNFRGMMGSVQKIYNFTMTPDELESYVTREEDVVIAKLKTSLRPCEGVDAELEKLAAAGDRTLAVVSSSALRRLQASVDKVNQARFFGDRMFSAATSLPVPTSKPDPAVYLHALNVLGKSADESVAIEDSKSGTLSGVRAGIKVIGYTGPYPADEKAHMEKVLTEAGAVTIIKHWSEFPSILDKLEKGEL